MGLTAKDQLDLQNYLNSQASEMLNDSVVYFGAKDCLATQERNWVRSRKQLDMAGKLSFWASSIEVVDDNASYQDAISFAIDKAGDRASEFLSMFRDGDFETISVEFPEFDSPLLQLVSNS